MLDYNSVAMENICGWSEYSVEFKASVQKGSYYQVKFETTIPFGKELFKGLTSYDIDSDTPIMEGKVTILLEDGEYKHPKLFIYSLSDRQVRHGFTFFGLKVDAKIEKGRTTKFTFTTNVSSSEIDLIQRLIAEKSGKLQEDMKVAIVNKQVDLELEED